MGMIIALVAVLLIGGLAWAGAAAGFQYLLGMALPLFAVAVFVGGIVWRIVYWAKSPVPFAIPTTGGQEKSLDWIRPARLDTPMSKAGVVGRMLLEVLLFRSLFRNTSAEVSANGPRATYFSSKWLWAFAVICLPVVGPVSWLILGRPVKAKPAVEPKAKAPDDDDDFLRGLR